MDLVVRSPRLPSPGETLSGTSFFTFPGGKGANQAVATAKLGIPTYLVGRVGDDQFGQELLNSLNLAGVETKYLLIDESVNSGVAVIAVDDAGENNIIIVAGANGRVNQEDVQSLTQLLTDASAVLLQLEIPLPTVILAAQAARQAGVPIILDPAPALLEIPDELYSLVNIITPNEIEAEQLVGFSINGIESIEKAASILRHKGVETVIIKLGAKGVFCSSGKEKFFMPAFPVEVVDTVAAGDAFNAGLVAALASGRSLREAVVWGAAVGAISTTKKGAQPSLPDRKSLEGFLVERGIEV